MPLYDFICHKCELFYTKEYSMSNAPDRSKCPSCKKLSNRHWHKVPIQFNGTDYHCNLGGPKKGHSDEVASELINSTKKRLTTGFQHYSKYTPSQKYLDTVGAKKLTEPQVHKGVESARQISKTLYDKAKRDPSKIRKPQ